MTDRSLRDAVAACETIAAGNNSTLFHAARLLPRHRRDVFSVAYAAMRVIDDIVDEEFLTLPPEVRDSQRPLVQRRGTGSPPPCRRMSQRRLWTTGPRLSVMPRAPPWHRP